MFRAGMMLAQSREVGELNQVFFITEAWMSTAEPNERPANRPSQDPQRKEILLISSLKVQQREQKSKVVEMVRDQTGQLTDLRDLPFGEEAEGDNRLLTAFVVGFTIASTANHN